jgi:hypothetical protein
VGKQRAFVLTGINVVVLAATVQARPLKNAREHIMDVFQLTWLVLIGNNLETIVDPNLAIAVAILVSLPIIVIAARLFLAAQHVWYRQYVNVCSKGEC